MIYQLFTLYQLILYIEQKLEPIIEVKIIFEIEKYNNNNNYKTNKLKMDCYKLRVIMEDKITLKWD